MKRAKINYELQKKIRKGGASTKQEEEKKKQTINEPIDLRGMNVGEVKKPGEPASAHIEKKKGFIGRIIEREREENKRYANLTFEKKIAVMKEESNFEAALMGTIGAGFARGITPTKFKPENMARITQETYAHELNLKTGGLDPRGTIQTQRGFVGKPGNSGVDKLFSIKPNVAGTVSRYSTNAKSMALSKSLLIQRGLSAAAVAFAAGTFGSYPFAAWAKQEVLGAVKTNRRDAIQAGDYELAEQMIALSEEIAANSWWRDLPYKNVIEEFVFYFEADKLSIELDKRLIAHARGEIEFEGTSIGEDIAQRDKEQEEKFAELDEKKQKEQEESDAKFAQIEEDRIKKQEDETARYAQIEADRKAKSLEEMRWKAEYYELIRQKKYDEAERLLESQS